MTVVVVAALVVAWCVAPFPLAVAVGRAFRAGEERVEVSPLADALR